jgi:uncharacterized repeat protein (TIGR01451 family)
VLAAVALGSVADAGFDVTADVTVTKDDGVGVVVAGESVTYTIVVSNAGPDAVAPTVSDPMSAELATMSWTCVPAGGADCAFGSGTGSLEDFPNLPIGGSTTYTVTATVRLDATGTLTNTASVIGAFNDANQGDNSATDVDSITPVSADLRIVKTATTAVVAGQAVTYDVLVDNLGPEPAAATVADALPAGFSDATWTCAASAGAACPAPSGSGDLNHQVQLGVGSSAHFLLTATLSSDASGSLTNTATVSSALSDPDPSNNSSSATNLIEVLSDVSVVKTAPATATAGSDITYVLTVANAGPSAAANVELVDLLPAGTTFGAIAQTSGPAATISAPAAGAGGTVTATWNALAAGATATFDVVVSTDPTLLPGDTVTNTATVAEGGSGASGFFGFVGPLRPSVDPNPVNDASTAVTEIVASPVGTTTAPTTEPPATTQPPATTAPPVTVAPSGDELPQTGASTGAVERLAALVLVAGVMVVALGGRRRRPADALRDDQK